MPRVSVLLPTHNRADVVELAVQSVLDQTETDFELLVVADGCTDGTVALIGGLDDARIRIFDLPKAPYYGYANRNIALRQARGEFVAFAAHDDLLFPDHLAQLIHALEVSRREWIYSRPLWMSTDGIIVPYATNLTIADELEHFLTVSNSIPAACVLYRSSCLEQYGYWPENVPSAADWRHWIGIIEGGQRRNLAYLPTPTCLHFSADWKTSRHSAVEEVRTWLEVADSGGWWPSVLRWQIPPGMPEQKAIALAMRLGGATWLHDVRAAVDAVIDRLAWDDIRVVRPRLHSRTLENQQLRAQAADLETELAALRDNLAAYRTLAETNAATLEVAEGELQAFHQLKAQFADLETELSALRDNLTAHNALATSNATQLEVAQTELGSLRDNLAAHKALAESNATQLEAAQTELAALRDNLAAHKALAESNATQLEVAERELQAVQHRLTLTLASTSWRLTAPMRTLKEFLDARR